MDGRPGTGERFAPKGIADDYKRIYNNEHQSDMNLSVYERLQNVLEQYEKSGLDIRFLTYQQDCHSPIKPQDLKNAQFENGTNFEKGGSQRAGELLKNTKELEEYAQNSDSNVAGIYRQISQKIIYDKGAGDRENKEQALRGLAREYELSREKNLITPEAIESFTNDRQVSQERENAVEAMNNLNIKENETKREEQK